MKSYLTLTAIFGFAALSPSSINAQVFTEVIRVGDLVPGAVNGELVTQFDNVDINNSGDWLIELNSSGDTDSDQFVLLNGNIIWREGTTIGFVPPAGMEAGSFVDVMDINDNGDILLTSGIRPVGTSGAPTRALIWNGVTVLQEEVSVSTAAGLPAGSVYRDIEEVWQNNNGRLLLTGSVDTGATDLEVLISIDLDPSGAILNEVLIAAEGMTLPGPHHSSPIDGFTTSKAGQAINDSGEILWFADDDQSTGGATSDDDTHLYIRDAASSNTLLYTEADPFPTDPAQDFANLESADVDFNNNGDFVFSGGDSGPFANNLWLFTSINGNISVLAAEGRPAPPSVPGLSLIHISEPTRPLYISYAVFCLKK